MCDISEIEHSSSNYFGFREGVLCVAPPLNIVPGLYGCGLSIKATERKNGVQPRKGVDGNALESPAC